MFRAKKLRENSDQLSQMVAMNSSKGSHFMSRAHLKGHSRNIFQVDQLKSVASEKGELGGADVAEYLGKGTQGARLT